MSSGKQGGGGKKKSGGGGGGAGGLDMAEIRRRTEQLAARHGFRPGDVQVSNPREDPSHFMAFMARLAEQAGVPADQAKAELDAAIANGERNRRAREAAAAGGGGGSASGSSGAPGADGGAGGAPACDSCGMRLSGGKLLRCSGCKARFYCDGGCQRLAWPEHKAFCKAEAARLKAKATAAAAAAGGDTKVAQDKAARA